MKLPCGKKQVKFFIAVVQRIFMKYQYFLFDEEKSFSPDFRLLILEHLILKYISVCFVIGVVKIATLTLGIKIITCKNLF